MLTKSPKFHLLTFTLSVAFAVNTFSEPQAASHVDLKSAFQAAIKNTESLGIQEAVTKQTEERLAQATGRILPNVSLLASYLKQAPTSGAAGGTAAFTRPDQYNVRLNLTQPLFKGLGDFAERRSREALWEAEQARSQVTRLALYSSVAQAYYNLLQAQQDLDNLRALQELTQKRSKELAGRVRIGRSRKGELLAADAQVATLEAQLEGAQLAVEQAREIFRFSTGLGEGTQLLDPKDAVPPVLPPLESMLMLVEARPDVTSGKAHLEAADEGVTVARAGHLPSLDFSANYYLQRTGVLADSKWDLGVQLSLPLFEGGSTQARVREAAELKKQRELTLSQSRRDAAKEVRSLYRELTSQLSQHRALKKALAIAENNYDVQNKDYRYGLATHLDVLQALNAFQETKRLLDRTRFQAMAAFASLRAATGTIE